MTDKPKKVRHTSRSLERHVRAPREHTWTVLLDLIEAGTGGTALEDTALEDTALEETALVETVLSFEPPWRRSYKVEGDHGLELYEGTFVLRDDGDECHVSWGLVVDPEPTEAGWAFVDLALGVIGGFLDRLVEAAEADAS
ncbi:MAG: SRPBCC family protein [Acidimicrobiales bacterium]|nr:SRPBCC family protein [Acidimicrobiales bacterium]